MNTKEKDSQYIMHTYGRYNVALKSGKGATAYDEDGKKYVDVASGIGVNSLGWCEDGWVKAVSELFLLPAGKQSCRKALHTYRLFKGLLWQQRCGG